MAERPILFSGPMVRELLAGRKTQTRRPVKGLEKARCAADCSGPQPERAFVNRGLVGDACEYLSVPCSDGAAQRVFCPYGAPGDRLWVRETWAPVDHFWSVEVDPPCSIGYAADRSALIFGVDGKGHELDTYAWNWDIVKWKPGIHLRRRDARLFLDVTEVRVERLDDLTEEDAQAEGMGGVTEPGDADLRYTFRRRWAAMYGAGSQSQGVLNPWVWVVTFRRVEASGG